MLFPNVLLIFLCVQLFNFASATTPVSIPEPKPTACGDTLRKANSSAGDLLVASQAYECLTSVPFNPAVALRFIRYYNDSIQFHTSHAYTTHPPQGYQQPPANLLQALVHIQNQILESQFPNQYEFEAAVQQAIYAVHDKHLNLNAGILSAFRFSSPFDFMSISRDGIREPNLYLRQHVKEAHDSNRKLDTISPVATINDQKAEDYLTDMIQKQSTGNLDPNADWNTLSSSPAHMISGRPYLLHNLVLYPGDTMELTLKNGTVYDPKPFGAVYIDPGPTGPLETGGDFYNFFVLGLYPKGFYDEVIQPLLSDEDPQSPDMPTDLQDPSDWEPTLSSHVPLSSPSDGWSEVDPAWPNPNLQQASFERDADAMITGYLPPNTDLAVLSIPTFEASGYAVNGFTKAIQRFLEECENMGRKRLVIDLQRNGGGSTTLAVDTFKRLFPDTDPSLLLRMRAHPMANELGLITDAKYQDWLSKAESSEEAHQHAYEFAASEWVASNRIDPATNENFAHWTGFWGPVQIAGDGFTKTQMYNFSDKYYVTTSLSYPETVHIVYGYPGNRAPNATAVFAASNITILTDGLCDSACALFVEMMRFDAGAKVVTVGGRPGAGPMQATGGTRGARSYDLSRLDDDMDFAKQWAKETGRLTTFLPERINDLYIVSAEINVRDHIRFGQDVPLQFKDDPTDCRLYHTMGTLFNQTLLWNLAADAIWNSNRSCVPSSVAEEPPSPPHFPHISTAPPTRDQEIDTILEDEFWELGSKGTQANERTRILHKRTGIVCTTDADCWPGEGSRDKFICVQMDTVRRCSIRCPDETFCKEDDTIYTGHCITRASRVGISDPRNYCKIRTGTPPKTKSSGR